MMFEFDICQLSSASWHQLMHTIILIIGDLSDFSLQWTTVPVLSPNCHTHHYPDIGSWISWSKHPRFKTALCVFWGSLPSLSRLLMPIHFCHDNVSAPSLPRVSLLKIINALCIASSPGYMPMTNTCPVSKIPAKCGCSFRNSSAVNPFIINLVHNISRPRPA